MFQHLTARIHTTASLGVACDWAVRYLFGGVTRETVLDVARILRVFAFDALPKSGRQLGHRPEMVHRKVGFQIVGFVRCA